MLAALQPIIKSKNKDTGESADTIMSIPQTLMTSQSLVPDTHPNCIIVSCIMFSMPV